MVHLLIVSVSVLDCGVAAVAVDGGGLRGWPAQVGFGFARILTWSGTGTGGGLVAGAGRWQGGCP